MCYRDAIDRVSYEQERDRLNQEILLAEIAEHEARIDQIDIQAAVKFGEFVLLNAPRLWTELPLAQKQRLQQIIFPRGVAFKDGAYRTSETSMIFFELGRW